MNRIAKSLMPRLLIVLTLAATFIVNPGFRTAAVLNSSAPIAAKTEAQFKDEAARYERALLAISKISSASLDTPEALQQALDVFKQQRTNIRFHRSKLVVKAISDPSFSAGVKRVANSVSAGEKLLKELNADRNAVLKIDGAKNLVSTLEESFNFRTDAAHLQKAGEALKAASEKIKASAGQKATHARNGFRITQVSFSMADNRVVKPNLEMLSLDPLTIIGGLAIAAALIVATVFIATAIQNLYNNLFTEEGRDAVTECQIQADEHLSVCLTSAGRLDGLLKLGAEGLCFSQWAIDQGQCLIKA